MQDEPQVPLRLAYFSRIQVDYLGKTQLFYPEEIISMLFRHLIVVAEKFLLPEKVSGVVFTISTSFNHAQRKSIMDAARITEIDVKGILNETTAAAVYYSHVSNCKASILLLSQLFLA